MLGNQYLNVNNQRHGIVKIWTEDSVYTLSDITQSSEAIDIELSGNDIYAVWNESDGKSKRPVLWKNGEKTYLNSPSAYTYATSLLIENNDIYVLGNSNHNGQSSIVLWKNKNIHSIIQEPSIKGVSLTLINQQPVICGYSNTLYYMTRGKIWQDGNSTVLTDTNFHGYALGVTKDQDRLTYVILDQCAPEGTIKIKGPNRSYTLPDAIPMWGNIRCLTSHMGNEYFFGSKFSNYKTLAAIWLNGTEIFKGSGKGHSTVTDLCFKGSDWYASGTEAPDGYNPQAMLWINGEYTQLKGINSLSEGIAIIVR